MRKLTAEEKESLERFVGLIGGKPLYRIEFAPDLFHIVNCEKRYKYPDPNAPDGEERPKGLYVLETFRPPEFFGTKDEWDISDGEYPENGEYIFRAFLSNETGGFLPICDAMFELVMLIVEMDKNFGVLSKEQQEQFVMDYYAKRNAKKKATEQDKLNLLNEESSSNQHKEGLQKVYSFGQKSKQLILPTNKEIRDYAKQF